MLLHPKGVVVSDRGKVIPRGWQVSMEKMSESKPSDDASLCPKVLSKLRWSTGFRTSRDVTCLRTRWQPVYNRRANYPHASFTFLGFTFRPRKALSKQDQLFTSFLPGASADALKRMRQAVRRWRLNRQTHVTLADVARLYNPVIQGWWQYYGSLYRTAMLGIFQHIDRALERWARRKYKALHRHKRRISQWLDKMRTVAPRLFHHWRVVGQQGWITGAV